MPPISVLLLAQRSCLSTDLAEMSTSPAGMNAMLDRPARFLVLCGFAAVFSLTIVSVSPGIQVQSTDQVHVVPLDPSKREVQPLGPPTAEGGLKLDLEPMRVNVDLVLVPVIVTDTMNHPVMGLDRSHFQLFEGDEPQQIEYFSVEDPPISVGLLLDLSKSMSNKMDTLRAAVNDFFDNANPKDDYFVITFADRPKLVANTTQSIGTIQGKLATVIADGNTALLDAISLGVAKLHAAQFQRRALVIVSDGGDNNSRYKLKDIKSLVQESDVLIDAIGIFDDKNLPGFKTIEEKMGKRWLDQITDATGGRTLTADNLSKVPGIAAAISRELRDEYVLGYRPNHPPHDGNWRKVKVRVTAPSGMGRLQAFYKKSYLASVR
jgi:Ca-activated chloride channel family protein